MMNSEMELSFAERQTPPWKWEEFSNIATMTDEVIEAGCVKVDILTMRYDEDECDEKGILLLEDTSRILGISSVPVCE